VRSGLVAAHEALMARLGEAPRPVELTGVTAGVNGRSAIQNGHASVPNGNGRRGVTVERRT
jgi:hypothetical protein